MAEAEYDERNDPNSPNYAPDEDLPPPGAYGVCVCFLPHEQDRREELEALLEGRDMWTMLGVVWGGAIAGVGRVNTLVIIGGNPVFNAPADLFPARSRRGHRPGAGGGRPRRR